MPLPLDGVRVVDVTSTIAGPYATLLLRDLGAEVIRVEPPGGDIGRSVGPSASPGMAAAYLTISRGKQSVVLDLYTPEGQERLKELCRTADVFVHNLRPESVQRLGADSETLRADHPELIHCGIRGFDGAGPYRDLPAYDDIIQAGCGIASQQEWMTGKPQYVANALADKVSGMMAALAVSAALHRRAATGEGSTIEVPMFESVTAFGLLEHMWGRTFVPPRGEARYPRQASPERRPYETSDGWIAVILLTDRHWTRFFDLIGRSELATDERYATVGARNANLAPLFALLDETLRQQSTDHWLKVLADAGIPVGRYNRVEDLFEDPQLEATDFFQRFVHPTEGELLYYVTPIRFDGQRPDLGIPARHLGEDGSTFFSPT